MMLLPNKQRSEAPSSNNNQDALTILLGDSQKQRQHTGAEPKPDTLSLLLAELGYRPTTSEQIPAVQPKTDEFAADAFLLDKNTNNMKYKDEDISTLPTQYMNAARPGRFARTTNLLPLESRPIQPRIQHQNTGFTTQQMTPVPRTPRNTQQMAPVPRTPRNTQQMAPVPRTPFHDPDTEKFEKGAFSIASMENSPLKERQYRRSFSFVTHFVINFHTLFISSVRAAIDDHIARRDHDPEAIHISSEVEAQLRSEIPAIEQRPYDGHFLISKRGKLLSIPLVVSDDNDIPTAIISCYGHP